MASAPPDEGENSLYGQGFAMDSSLPPSDAAVEPTSLPVISLPSDANQAPSQDGKTPGQKLDELQKAFIRKLDEQATQAGSQ